MASNSSRDTPLFYSYAQEDKALCDELNKHLATLRRQNIITTWDDRDISPGAEWEREINTHLEEADIILLMVSPDFIHSNDCYSNEMSRALVRHQEGSCCVIPIILRPVDWEGAPFSKLQVLPTDAKAISSWSNRDEAFKEVAIGIRKAVEKLRRQKQCKQWLNEGQKALQQYRYQEALAACSQAIRLDPNDATAYKCKGDALTRLGDKRKAQQAYARVRQLGNHD